MDLIRVVAEGQHLQVLWAFEFLKALAEMRPKGQRLHALWKLDLLKALVEIRPEYLRLQVH